MRVRRDWLLVDKLWNVYGLTDFDLDGYVFYVGVTQFDVATRLAQHRTDPNSAAYGHIKYIEDIGARVGYCVFAKCQKAAAFHLENALIVALPHLLNRTNERAGDAFWQPFVGVRFYAS